jgi:hypothetical protein
MAKKQFVVVTHITLGKTPYEMVGGEKNKFNSPPPGSVFEADDAKMEKLLRLGAIKPYTGAKEPAPDVAESVEEPQKRGRR